MPKTLVLLLLGLQAGDWPQYRGPARDDVSAETGLLKSWPPEGPPLLWTFRDAGVGDSGPAVVGDVLYTLGGRGDTEFLIALDLRSGKEAWATAVGPLFQFDGNKMSAGPSATSTVGDRLICLPGGPKGTVAALDRKTGRVLWRSAEVVDQAAYTSPMAAEIDGLRQIVVLTNQGLFAVAAQDGRLLWRSKRDVPYVTEVINTPLIQGSQIYTTVVVNNGGGELVKASKDGAQVLWSQKNLSNHHGKVIRVGEFLYGNGQGRGWVCQNVLDGKNLWEEKAALGAGALAYADGRLYACAENDGATALVEASPAGWRQAGRLRLPEASKLRKPSGRLWTPPVVAGGRLFLRDQELLFCYDVKAK